MTVTLTRTPAYARTFPGTPDQVQEVRAAISSYLDGSPVTATAVLIISELAANAVVHSRSGDPGGMFTVRCQPFPEYVWLECRDQGGPWAFPDPEEKKDRPHGLDIVSALVGPDNYGVRSFARSGTRVVWVKIPLEEVSRATLSACPLPPRRITA